MILASLLAAAAAAAPATATPVHFEGRLQDGAAYAIDMPGTWNGTLLLWSRGYAPAPPPPEDAPPGLKAWLLARGYALAGSSYAQGGWALEQAVPDQIATLAAFRARFAAPARTIAWGQSMGGLVTVALAERHPAAITAALPMCGSLAGSVGMMNGALAGAFAFTTLVAPTAGIALVQIDDDRANGALVETQVKRAMATPQGRARLALAATLAQLPHWTDPAAPEPAAQADEDAVVQQAHSFTMGVFLPRGDQERRAGGVFSWTAGLDYDRLLHASGQHAYVERLYRTAGLDLAQDLKALAEARPIVADSAAIAYMADNYSPSGDLRVPMLALHTTGDGLTVPNNLAAYAAARTARGRGDQFRAITVRAAGHCTFAPAEMATALQALESRLERRRWQTSPAAMNAAAASTGLGQARYKEVRLAPFLRPYPAAPPKAAAQGQDRATKRQDR